MQNQFCESVTEARRMWTDGRESVHAMHESGASGSVVVREMSDVADRAITHLFKCAAEDFSETLTSRIAVVLLGGSGRQDIAPYSDVDLMILYEGPSDDELRLFSSRLRKDVTDAGAQLGFSLRTAREACMMAMQDPVIASSMTESRLLIGNAVLFKTFFDRFRRLCNRKSDSVIAAMIEARNKERTDYGETVYLLRPNVKRSHGGLRDIHMIRWLGFVQHGSSCISELLKRGGISTADATQLFESHEFLLKVRNEMHFHAGRANDGLGRNEQVRLAELFGYSGDDSMMSVESFMREYFRYTSRVSYISDHFVDKMKKRGGMSTAILAPITTQLVDQHFRLGSHEIGIKRSSMESIKHDLDQVLRLMQLCCLYDRHIEHETWITIRHAMLKFPNVKFTRETAHRFMALLSNTQGLGRSLRRLHEMQVLRTIIPQFDHVRGLLQFNEYHKYTVDEHSLRAVENAIGFESDDSLVGKVYRAIKNKNLLHLALLLHDLGKGLPEDHSIVGERIAEKIGRRFELPEKDVLQLMWLVRQHLWMSHLALHRDINDQQMVAEFATNVGSVEQLGMLFVLTCADMSAVGPDVLNPWKMGLLNDLFDRARAVLNGDGDVNFRRRFDRICETISMHVDDADTRHWVRKVAQSLPSNFLQQHDPAEIAQHLTAVKDIQHPEVYCWVQPREGSNIYELGMVYVDSKRSGTFYRLNGVMRSLGLQVRSADIKQLEKEKMFSWFQFEDSDYLDGQSPPERLEQIRTLAIDSIFNESGEKPKFRKVWGVDDNESRAIQLSRPTIDVKINNTTVQNATIIDVFAYDKPGLLHRVSRKIYRLGLDVMYARIATYAHQVIDVFYVTDEQGNKIRNDAQLQLIRREILEEVRNYLEPDSSGDHQTDTSSDQELPTAATSADDVESPS